MNKVEVLVIGDPSKDTKLHERIESLNEKLAHRHNCTSFAITYHLTHKAVKKCPSLKSCGIKSFSFRDREAGTSIASIPKYVIAFEDARQDFIEVLKDMGHKLHVV